MAQNKRIEQIKTCLTTLLLPSAHEFQESGGGGGFAAAFIEEFPDYFPFVIDCDRLSAMLGRDQSKAELLASIPKLTIDTWGDSFSARLPFSDSNEKGYLTGCPIFTFQNFLYQYRAVLITKLIEAFELTQADAKNELPSMSSSALTGPQRRAEITRQLGMTRRADFDDREKVKKLFEAYKDDGLPMLGDYFSDWDEAEKAGHITRGKGLECYKTLLEGLRVETYREPGATKSRTNPHQSAPISSRPKIRYR